ncbi:hypothetical protein HX792_10840 [Pseudomonas sp. B6002]|uniref:hypothetical protein n=1 Tax=Pseudomonas sp. B6002 TaxID=2726978 RepID=UPI0015A0BE7F|nr:hypothetical protein [Pseudomonas sp. B6002]NVZ50833.1 hypothetical protein [Pseudomonas sp. B6002]
MIRSHASLDYRLPSTSATQIRNKREVPNEGASPVIGLASTTSGDKGVLELYVKALRNVAGGSTDGVNLDNIPADSTFGQWWQQLYNAVKSPRFEALAKKLDIDTSSPMTVDHINETLTAMVNGEPMTFSTSQLGRAWAEATAPILSAARALGYSRIKIPTHPTTAPVQEVARFYGEVLLADRKEQTLARATQLEHNQTFDQKGLDKPFVNLKARAPEQLEEQVTALGNNNVKFNLLNRLMQFNSNEHVSLADFLRDTKMPLAPNSSYTKDTGHSEVSLEDVLATYDWHIPKNQQELNSLINNLAEPALSRPQDGNFAGALAWPTPLTVEERAEVFRTLADNHPRLPVVDPDTSLGSVDVLGALVSRVPSFILRQDDPLAVIEWILNAEEGQQLGAELLKRAGDKAGGASPRTWLLTVMGIMLDVKSLKEPQANHVAGFNLGGHEGQTPAQIKQALIDHLSRTFVTTPQAAPMAAVLLLSRAAPELLVKDIPEYITKGSFEWLALKAAVARIEALSPGASTRMSYGEVLAFDEVSPATDEEAELQRESQLPAIIDWGESHGTLGLTGPHSPQNIEYTRRTIEAQQNALARAYAALKEQAPSQRSVALAELKATLGEGIDFEAKTIRAHIVKTDGHRLTPSLTKDPVGHYSLLDLYLAKRAGDDVGWFSSNPKITQSMIKRVGTLPDPIAKHEKAFDTYESELTQGWATLTKNLIANLPMGDRKNIEYGKLTVYQTGETTRSDISTGSGSMSVNNGFAQTGSDRSLIIKTERDGQVTYYQIDPQHYVIRKREDLNATFKEGAQGEWVERPSNSYLAKNFAVATVRPIATSSEHAATEGDSVPVSFTSPRSEYVGKLLSDNIVPLYRLGMQKDASREVTTFDREASLKKTFHEIFLGIVPGASAIRHIINGDYVSAAGDTLFDLVMGVTLKGLSPGKAAGKGLRSPGLKQIGRTLKGFGHVVGRGAGSTVPRFFHRLKTQLGAKPATANASPALRLTPEQARAVAARKDLFEGIATSGNGVAKRTIAKYDAATSRWREFDPTTGGTASVLHTFDPIVTTHLDTQWMNTIRKAENGPQGAAYRTGYLEGKPEGVPGYAPGMTSAQIKKLTVSGNLSPKDIGTLVRQQERLAVNSSLNGVIIFNKEVRAAGGRITPMPQLFYLSQTQPLSQGQCAALSHLMLEAMQRGKGQALIDNFYAVAANPKSAASRQFINTLNDMQAKLTTPTAFHGGSAARVPYSTVADQLIDANGSKTLLIGDSGHAMTAGVRVESGAKKYFFYEPNYGLATFESAESFKQGLDNIFTSKAFSRKYTTVDPGSSEVLFTVSDYKPNALNQVGINSKALEDLYSTPL